MPVGRSHDPARKERILIAAADLVSRHGYHAASMADIGGVAGITGPGIYRHFASKSAILVALFDEAVDRLLASEAEILREESEPRRALVRLVSDQVDFVVADRYLAQVYYSEFHHIPDEDRQRLRRKQRRYIDEWTQLCAEIRPERSYAEVQSTVHSAVGAIQSALFHRSQLPGQALRETLTAAAWRVLALDA
jgi:AcrR family transcriptional regulator